MRDACVAELATVEVDENWDPRFAHQEVWIMNTEYKLYHEHGPLVDTDVMHRGRFDEMSKCLAVSPGNSSVRLFWADAVISVEGPDLGLWMKYIGKPAPSEQQMSHFLWANIQAAWRGERWARSLEDAIAIHEAGKSSRFNEAPGQPTPGVVVRRTPFLDGEGGWKEGGAALLWPTRPTAESVARCLSMLCMGDEKDEDAPGIAQANVLGVLLDVHGAELRCFGKRPLVRGVKVVPDTVVWIIGGPRGISQPFKEMIRDKFEEKGTPLLEVCLGPYEQMAHAIVAYMRIEADAGRLKPALLDLLWLGKDLYAQTFASVEGFIQEALLKRFSGPAPRSIEQPHRVPRRQRRPAAPAAAPTALSRRPPPLSAARGAAAGDRRVVALRRLGSEDGRGGAVEVHGEAKGQRERPPASLGRRGRGRATLVRAAAAAHGGRPVGRVNLVKAGDARLTRPAGEEEEEDEPSADEETLQQSLARMRLLARPRPPRVVELRLGIHPAADVVGHGDRAENFDTEEEAEEDDDRW